MVLDGLYRLSVQYNPVMIMMTMMTKINRTVYQRRQKQQQSLNI